MPLGHLYFFKCLSLVGIDCVMGQWTNWSEMIEGGLVTRSRRIMKKGNQYGEPCGETAESKKRMY